MTGGLLVLADQLLVSLAMDFEPFSDYLGVAALSVLAKTAETLAANSQNGKAESTIVSYPIKEVLPVSSHPFIGITDVFKRITEEAVLPGSNLFWRYPRLR